MSDSPAPETETDEALNKATGLFLDHRELLFAITYDKPGGIADTKGLLQPLETEGECA
jgi:RNA polymerase sigma-70 factor (ECF subfamily)